MTQHPKYSSREAQALAEAGKTKVSMAQKRLLAIIFLLAIFFIPLSRQIIDVHAYFAGTRKTIVPQCYDIFGSAFSAVAKVFRPDGGVIGRLLQANRQLLRDMHAYEDALEDSAFVGKLIRPFTQYVMTSLLGAGNDKTYCGSDHWLFYRPDVDYVIGKSFLKPEIMARRIMAASETKATPQPDPRKAIIAFNKELAARGIKLILVPTPVKPVIQPEKFVSGFDGFYKPVHNPSCEEFIKDMEREGILVFDAAQAFVQDKEENKQDQFLVGDTHWRPEAMQLCARLLSGFIKKNIALTPVPSAGYAAVRTNIIQRGDIVAMLCLPEGARGYGPENVAIRQIFEPDGRPWQPSPESEALVLGDSFSNIYSLEALGWGTNAGLVEQLSYEMDGKIDRIAVNDNGAWATRELLRKEILRGNNRLAGKRVVIWQFAERELSEGDWKILPLDIVVKQASFIKLPPGPELVVRGRIEKISPAPRPRSVPYADHIVAVHLVNIADSKNNQYGQALVYLFSMTNNVLTKAAGLKAGDVVELKLCPWSDVSAKYERINRTDLDDFDLLAQEPCWGEFAPEGK